MKRMFWMGIAVSCFALGCGSDPPSNEEAAVVASLENDESTPPPPTPASTPEASSTEEGEGISIDLGSGNHIRIRKGESGAGSVVVTDGPNRLDLDFGGGRVSVNASDRGGVTVKRAGGGSQTCDEGDVCEFPCPAGGCETTCATGTQCVASCSGGGCRQSCAAGASCTWSCSGGGCDRRADEGAVVLATCTGGGCG